MNDDTTLPAGEFGAWLNAIRVALRADLETEVACGTCVGCCVSSYHITLRPRDAAARERIPAAVVVESPALPPGHALLRYDARGHCPMLHEGRCSIYAHRPQTCRTYDCRVLAAAGIGAGGPDKAVIDDRVQRWRFTYATPAARSAHVAVRAAAQFIRNDATSFPAGRAPMRPNDVAVAAIAAYELFLAAPVPEAADAKRVLAQRVLAAYAQLVG